MRFKEGVVVMDRKVDWNHVVRYGLYIMTNDVDFVGVHVGKHPQYGWVAIGDEQPSYWTVN